MISDYMVIFAFLVLIVGLCEFLLSFQKGENDEIQ
jgi:hypothetical protein